MVSRHVWSACIAALVIAASAAAAADNNQKEFEKYWVGRVVIVKRPLYSLVYNENGLAGGTKAGRSGLTVVTPSQGTYFQFDGRSKVDDVIEQDIQKIAHSVLVAYQKEKLLGEGFLQKIDPVLISVYDAGVLLKVSTARVQHDSVRLTFVQAAGEDQELATSLIVKWPAPLSKAFSERGNIEGLIQQYVTVRD